MSRRLCRNMSTPVSMTTHTSHGKRIGLAGGYSVRPRFVESSDCSLTTREARDRKGINCPNTKLKSKHSVGGPSSSRTRRRITSQLIRDREESDQYRECFHGE